MKNRMPKIHRRKKKYPTLTRCGKCILKNDITLDTDNEKFRNGLDNCEICNSKKNKKDLLYTE